MNVKIVEIVARSAQGITRPFLCRGDDGWLYFVKGKGAGNRALISEWMAGHLGKRLGLPIPDFKQATIPPELIRLSARDDIAELGSGTGFASQMIENTDELTYLFIEQIDVALRAKILLLDWWPQWGPHAHRTRGKSKHPLGAQGPEALRDRPQPGVRRNRSRAFLDTTHFRLLSSRMEPRVSPAEPNRHEGDSCKPQGMVASNAI